MRNLGDLATARGSLGLSEFWQRVRVSIARSRAARSPFVVMALTRQSQDPLVSYRTVAAPSGTRGPGVRVDRGPAPVPGYPQARVALRSAHAPRSWSHSGDRRGRLTRSNSKIARAGWAVPVASGLFVMILGGCYRNPMGYRPRSRKSHASRSPITSLRPSADFRAADLA
jgi:hypothetical protein